MAPEPLDLLRLALAEHQRFARLVADLAPDELDRPTRLTGWVVRDLVAHVAWGQAMEAAALRKALDGEAGPLPPGPRPAAPDPVGALHRGHAALTEAVAAVAEHADVDSLGAVRLPTGVLPVQGAALLFAVEATTHAADLADALGVAHALTPEALTACIAFTVPLLDYTGALGCGARVGTTLALRGCRLTVRATRDEKTWRFETGPGNGPVDVTVAGSDEALVLFTLGRLAADSDRLSVSGDADLAARFKDFFPGP